MTEKIKKLRWRYAFLGALLAIIGFCFLFFSNSAVALTIIVGLFTALVGAAIGALCIMQKKRDFIFFVKLSVAILIFICGILTAVFNDKAFFVLSSVFCLLLTVDGAFKFLTSVKLKRYSVENWWILLAVSVCVVISSFLIARISPESIKATSIWLGITLIFGSSMNFLSALFAPKCKSAEKAEIYYEVYEDIQNSSAE